MMFSRTATCTRNSERNCVLGSANSGACVLISSSALASSCVYLGRVSAKGGASIAASGSDGLAGSPGWPAAGPERDASAAAARFETHASGCGPIHVSA